MFTTVLNFRLIFDFKSSSSASVAPYHEVFPKDKVSGRRQCSYPGGGANFEAEHLPIVPR